MPSADNLSSPIWNAIADQIDRVAAQHEIVFAPVTKVDPVLKIIYADGFGEMGIPLVGFHFSFSYYDTQDDGALLWRGDKTQKNPIYRAEIVMPAVGDIALILDLAGTKSYPVCIGTLLSKSGFWESD